MSKYAKKNPSQLKFLSMRDKRLPKAKLKVEAPKKKRKNVNKELDRKFTKLLKLKAKLGMKRFFKKFA